jgi:hypothetical protein
MAEEEVGHPGSKHRAVGAVGVEANLQESRRQKTMGVVAVGPT